MGLVPSIIILVHVPVEQMRKLTSVHKRMLYFRVFQSSTDCGGVGGGGMVHWFTDDFFYNVGWMGTLVCRRRIMYYGAQKERNNVRWPGVFFQHVSAAGHPSGAPEPEIPDLSCPVPGGLPMKNRQTGLGPLQTSFHEGLV